ncbi:MULTISPECIES: threonine synthase [unclassified Sporosarcina]|uniref:threonine synthase n=1 Tax=unclassified Sporosarcina TaxID=2647733 RepID=UPI00203CFC4B|nr:MULTISPECIES: threonine synthase [unclassified Sporosarcina]GKV65188.1 threonine synthase [Sporosarcina sp. NCCP-2331]GLB55312.1 threonine synthase [Sporosarcina sp. NCCP-2378]
MTIYICSVCNQVYPIEETRWKCECGGILDLLKPEMDPGSFHWTDHPSIWRYASSMGAVEELTAWPSVTLGEGQTPLLVFDEEEPDTYVKMEYMMPTLSFKDRGAAVLVTLAKQLGVRKMIADSSGNAGTAIAAYAARAGIACDVYVSAHTSPKKLAQIKAHGAEVRAIEGTREEVAAAAQSAVLEEQVFYASHVYNPYFYEGTKTYAFEIFEQLQKAPDTVLVPVGNGTLVLGVYYGFKELLETNKIGRMPKIVAIQAERCAPLAKAFANQEPIAKPVVNEGTLAEGIAIAAPARSKQVLEAIRETGGMILTVGEEAILEARDTLAKRGFYVEVTSAINYAGYMGYAKAKDEVVVIPLCGAGVKSD